MTAQPLLINPTTKIADVLNTYPQLEAVLLEMSPAFAKLKNPILRNTIAKVASLLQAAIIAEISVEHLVTTLRAKVGQATETIDGNSAVSFNQQNVPTWVTTQKVMHVYNASPVIEAGESPMKYILDLCAKLELGTMLELQTPFMPAPIIDMLQSKGYSTYSYQKEKLYSTYILRN